MQPLTAPDVLEAFFAGRPVPMIRACGWCHRIKDDHTGRWVIASPTRWVVASHGICPTCRTESFEDDGASNEP